MTNETLKIILDWAGEHYILAFFAILAIGRFANIFHFVRIRHETKTKTVNKNGELE